MIEVLKQALESLEVEQTVYLRTKLPAPEYLTKAIASLRPAIAELESQERNFCPRCGKRTPDAITIHTCTPPQRTWVGSGDLEDSNAYINPPQRKWKNLRSSTINRLFIKMYGNGIKDGGQSFARAIEAKLKELNT